MASAPARLQSFRHGSQPSISEPVAGVVLDTKIYSGNPHKEPRLFLGSLDRFLSNGLAFSSPALKVLNKVLIYQSFLNSGPCKK